jgi:hypothetical protein
MNFRERAITLMNARCYIVRGRRALARRGPHSPDFDSVVLWHFRASRRTNSPLHPSPEIAENSALDR